MPRKITRKLISLAILGAMLMTFVPSAWAQGEGAKITREEAMKIARDTFGIPEGLKNVDISYREESYFGNRKIWEFNWNMSILNRYRHISVSIDADTGEIIQYSENEDWSNAKKPAKYKTREECRQIAEAMLQRLAPEKFKQSRPVEQPYPEYDYYGGFRTYSFTYVRMVNGIPFSDNTLTVNVNAGTGKVIHYYSNWDNSVEFPRPDGVITAEQAERIFREQIGLRLAYVRPYGPYPPGPVNAGKPVQLYYTVEDFMGGGSYIDAFSGKLIDGFGKEVKVPEKVYLPVKEEPPAANQPGKTLTLEEARAKAGEYVDIPSDYTVQNSRYAEGWYPGSAKTWEFQFGPSDYRGGENISVTINAQTGELINYHRWEEIWGEQEEKPVNYDYNRCKQIALAYLKKVAPQKAEQVYLQEFPRQDYYYVNGKEVKSPAYSFNFVRVVNGVPFNMNNISISVNNNTGKVRAYWSNWDENQTFASRDGIITEKEAVESLLALEKPTLKYTRKASEDGRPAKEVMLVYTLYNQVPKMVNARTGEVENVYNYGVPVELKDIDGHWAEREIRILAAWGVVSGNKEKKFNPDRTITRAEFISMLAAAKGLEPGSEEAPVFIDVPKTAWYFNAVQAAARAGLLKGSGKKFNPNQPISRQEMVVMLMNAANSGGTFLQEDLTDVLQAEFKDADKIAGWAKNAVAQALQMGILTGQNGYIKPTNPATRAEAAVLLARTLQVSAGLGY
ncbi:S-layer protein [Thermincola ferriacetica]|uniref:S-layer protein n=1 Tax=Thermincola ferriacetica TaxID=281456 RepID=A0A0L6W0W6_9FIRM|nr:S-layer homology domain-containing protein [Thermincola ferriacetica]KNZ68724.1 S-layer protein [Thermincola ferriacetica]